MFELKFQALSSSFASFKTSDGSTAKALEAKKYKKYSKNSNLYSFMLLMFYTYKDSRLTNPPKAINITPSK